MRDPRTFLPESALRACPGGVLGGPDMTPALLTFLPCRGSLRICGRDGPRAFMRLSCALWAPGLFPLRCHWEPLGSFRSLRPVHRATMIAEGGPFLHSTCGKENKGVCEQGRGVPPIPPVHQGAFLLS